MLENPPFIPSSIPESLLTWDCFRGSEKTLALRANPLAKSNHGASRILGCRESGKGPGGNGLGDGKVSSSSFALQLAQDFLRCPGSPVTTPHGAACCSQPLHSRILLSVTPLPLGCLNSRGGCSWLEGRLRMLAEVCVTQAAISSTLARTKTRLCMSHHSRWYYTCTENVRTGETPGRVSSSSQQISRPEMHAGCVTAGGRAD